MARAGMPERSLPQAQRRRLLARAAAASVLLAAGPLAAQAPAQAPGRPLRILMITFRGETDVERGFRAQLQAAGVRHEIFARDVQRDVRNVPPILAELPQLRPDLIYTWGTPVTLAVAGPHDAPDPTGLVRGIPVVFALVAAPVQARIVPSLERPGRAVTGAVHVVPTDVQLRTMQAYRPFKRMGVLYSTTEPNSVAIVAQARAFCAAHGATLVERTFALGADGRPTAEGVEDKVAALKDSGAEWLYLLPDTFLGTVYDRVAPAAVAQRLPTFGAAELAVREGGALVGLVSRYYSVGQLAASKALEILVGGRRAADIPVETLRRFSLLINLRTAHALGGIYPPIDMLNYAEVVAGPPAGAGAV